MSQSQPHRYAESIWRYVLPSAFLFLVLHVGYVSIGAFLPDNSVVRSLVGSAWLNHPPKPTGDGIDYEIIGFNVSCGNGWATSFSDDRWRRVYESDTTVDYSEALRRRGPLVSETSRPPLFPLVIGATYCLLPRGPMAFVFLHLFQAACISIGCAIAVGLGVRLARRCQLSPLWLTVAMVAIVLSERNLCNYATDFITEPLALLLTSLFLYAIARSTGFGDHSQVSDSNDVKWGVSSPWTAIGCGFLFAMMYFCRGVFVLWFPLLLIWIYILYEQNVAPKSRLLWLGAFALSFAVSCSPWWIRNCMVLESFSPLGTKGAITMLGGYCDESLAASGEWKFAPEQRLRKRIETEQAFVAEQASGADVLEVEKRMASEADRQVKSWAAEHLLELPILACMRLITEWNPYTGKALLLKLAAIVGLFGLWRRYRYAAMLLAGPLVINSAIVFLTYSVGGRFLVPTYGAFYLLAAFGIVMIVEWSIALIPNKSNPEA